MVAHHLNSTVHIGLVGYKTLAEVVGFAGSLQDFSLEERQGRVVPARTAAVLILDGCNLVLLDDGEHGFVLVDRVLFRLCLSTTGDEGHECQCHEFLHTFTFFIFILLIILHKILQFGRMIGNALLT